ncbi:MAG TPA: hypothetical protein VGM39_14350 [Kofleriaceae bacterium]|jgi:hypothetical protein
MLQQQLSKLRARGAVFAGGEPELNDRVDEETLAVLDVLKVRRPDGPMLALYDQLDGVALHWTLPGVGSGGLAIPDAMKHALRPGKDERSKPLEGVLWSDQHDDARLRRMYIIDASALGDFITYIPGDDRAYFIESGEIRACKTTLAETIELLVRFVGADSLREHLVHDDWRERIANDPALWL